MKKTFRPAVLSMAVALGITGVSAGGAYAAPSANPSTSQLDWSYKVPDQLDLASTFRFGTFAGDNLYLQAVDGHNSQIVQAFDQENGGKDNWTYDFQGDAKQLTSGGYAIQDKNGNSYYVRKKDGEQTYKLEAVDANGKLKWNKDVGSKAIERLQVLHNGDIVVSGSVAPTKTVNSHQVFYVFGADGKVKNTQKIDGSEINNSGAYIKLLPNGQVLAISPKLQLFKSLNDLKKPILEYELPEWNSIDFDVRGGNFGEAVYSLSGGNTLVVLREEDYSAVPFKEGAQEIDLSIVKQSKSVVLFDANGKKKWERELWQDAAIVPTADGFVLQKDNKIELYGQDNKLKTSKTVEGDDVWLAKAKTTDEIVLTSKEAGTFQALDPKDLSVKYEIDMKETAGEKADYSFLYEGDGELYVHTMDWNVNKSISHYSLK
ncbi:hypothetical protein [Saccharibacillus sacchari]|uniref:Uncharacterized protein n=1 Tax=Saccharibacillus sacchari TaxID=456493 RepID=A0ACC6PHE6_9BACL